MKAKLYAMGVVVVAVVAILGWRYYVLHSTNLHLSAVVSETEKSLADANHEKSDLSDALHNAEDSLANLQAKVGDLSNTVGTLTKLKDTDPELLKKYSKVYFLSENYVPRGLSAIDVRYKFDKAKSLQFLTKAEPHLYNMLDRAKEDGVDLLIASAYRSFSTQSGLNSAYKVTYGKGTANSFSADQGYSEHQIGTAVDFTTTKLGGGLTGFEKTSEYEWLTKYAYKYGFILSYPKGNDYYIFEPWHWRFVGVSLATRLHEEHQNFIDLEQRQLDPYLINIFD